MPSLILTLGCVAVIFLCGYASFEVKFNTVSFWLTILLFMISALYFIPAMYVLLPNVPTLAIKISPLAISLLGAFTNFLVWSNNQLG